MVTKKGAKRLHLPKCLFLLTASAQVQVEPVGRWFEAYIRRRNRNVSSSFQELEEEEESSEESADEEFQLEEYSMLRKLDPKDWKVCDNTPQLFAKRSLLSHRY